ncbi:MAG: hypothetical protein L0387_27060 [Acidobacteria bacterium]|nr:hypothetical protein [Acidobacteriota bacterium]
MFNDLTVVGIGDDALPVLLAAATDARMRRVVVAGYFHSFVSQMRARTPRPKSEMPPSWNDPQLNGRVNSGDYEVDFGSVIPFALETADVPEIAALIAPRRVLFCQYGAGLCELITPTNGAVMAVLATAGVRFDQWLRFVGPIYLALAALGGLAIVTAVNMGLK